MVISFPTFQRWRAAVASTSLILGSLVLGILLWALPAQATGVYNIPRVSPGEPTWIVDDADIISRFNEGKLGSQLASVAEDTGVEVRFVTIHRLDYGETSQSFADALFTRWFPTEDEQANQVLIVLDNVTNTTALHVADNLAETLTPAIAESIAQETLQVPIRADNKYNQAFLDASDRLAAVLAGEPDPGPPVVEMNIRTEGTFADADETDAGSSSVLVIGFLIAATIIPMVTYYFYVR